MMEIVGNIALTVFAVEVFLMMRVFWHEGSAYRLENQAEVRQHELDMLRLEIELELLRHGDPDHRAPSGGWPDGGEEDGEPQAEATPAA